MVPRRDSHGPSDDRPDPSDKPDVVALGPGQSDHSFTLQAIAAVQRDIGALGAKLDRVINDNEIQGDKLDALRHQVSFVRGAIWVVGAVFAVACFLVANKVHISFGDIPQAGTPIIQQAPRSP